MHIYKDLSKLLFTVDKLTYFTLITLIYFTYPEKGGLNPGRDLLLSKFFPYSLKYDPLRSTYWFIYGAK